MTTTITREQLRQWGACYTDAQIAALIPESGLQLIDVARLPIPPEDIIWVATRHGVLPDSILWEWTARIVERALARVPNPDPRSLAVVPLLRRLAAGEKVSKSERDAARAAAWDAAWAADRAAERKLQLDDLIALLTTKERPQT